MKRSDRFKPVLNVAQQKENNEAKLLGRMHQELSVQTKKLDTLTEYQKDYQQRFNQEAAKGMSAIQLQSYQNFISKLDHAIIEQQKSISRVQEACQSQQVQWHAQKRQTQVLDNVMQRYQSFETKQSIRNEQRTSDEMVANRYWHSLNKAT